MRYLPVDILLKYIRDSVSAEKAKESRGRSSRFGSFGSFGGGGDAGIDDDAEDAATAALRQDKSVKLVKEKKGGKAKKAKEVPKMLQRPIICICNDLYAPALRNLRKECKLIKMTPPSAQRMVGRLQIICEKEKLKADRQALTLLHELHSGYAGLFARMSVCGMLCACLCVCVCVCVCACMYVRVFVFVFV